MSTSFTVAIAASTLEKNTIATNAVKVPGNPKNRPEIQTMLQLLNVERPPKRSSTVKSMAFDFKQDEYLVQTLKFTPLPLLLHMRNEYGGSYKPTKLLLVGVQHLNETTGALIESLVDLGLLPSDILILGKNYSSNPKTIKKLQTIGCNVQTVPFDIPVAGFAQANAKKIEQLWSRVAAKLASEEYDAVLLMDDGGRLISSAPEEIVRKYAMASIEQTTKGIRNNLVQACSFPVISVAASRLKIGTESKIIAKGIIAGLERLDIKVSRVGIVGLGTIGMALKQELETSNTTIMVFDSANPLMSNCDSIEDLIRRSDIIFGCTGTELQFTFDCLEGKQLIFASCSSEDVEFKQVLLALKNIKSEVIENMSPDLIGEINPNAKVRVLNSGYPVNFRNNTELEPPENIQLTRGLLLAGVFQAFDHFSSSILRPGLNSLDEHFQSCIEMFFSTQAAKYEKYIQT